MADRIDYDPNLEPEFNADDPAVAAFLQAVPEGEARDELRQRLQTMVQDARNARIERFTAQQAADWQQEEEAAQLRAQADQAARDDERRREEEERREAEKKIPKIADFDYNTAVADDLSNPPTYAIECLRKRKLVPLWYFTEEANQELAKLQESHTEDALHLSKGDGGLVLKPSISEAHAKKVVPDQNLTWKQMCSSYTNLLDAMRATGWPKKHCDALASFFFLVEKNKLQHMPHGERALLLYMASVRRKWHDALLHPDEDSNKPFNIGLFNQALLDGIARKVLLDDDNELRIQVSTSPLAPAA